VSDWVKDWVTLALLGKTRGNRGELLAQPLGSRAERFDGLQAVYLTPDESKQEPVRYGVENVWWHERRLVLKFVGIDSISAAEVLQGWQVCVPRAERAPIEPGEYYLDDLVGCAVVDHATSEPLGTVTAWSEAGGGSMLEVDDDWMLPFVKAICVGIEPEQRRIRVDLPAGLRELNRP
jgi:16S rRNA processing protein RimM